jgi:hypothetical protein
MLNSLIGSKDQHNAYEKLAQSLKIIVDEILKVLNNNKKDSKDATEKTFIREAVTDFFASLLSEASEYLVKRYK